MGDTIRWNNKHKSLLRYGQIGSVLLETAEEYSEYCVFSTLFDNAWLTTSIKKHTPWGKPTYSGLEPQITD